MNKNSFSRNIITTSILATVIVLSGCQSTSEKLVEQQQQTQENNGYFLTAKNAIDTLDERFKKAEEENIAYFSENIFNDAIDEKEDANNKFEKIRFTPYEMTESKNQSILSDVAKANEYLDQVFLIKQSAEIILAQSFKQNEVLKEYGAESFYGEEYGDAQEQLSDLIELIADGKPAKAQEKQSELLPLLFSLEIKIVEDIELKELRELLVGLKKTEVDDISPISYQNTIGLAHSAESVISTDPKDIDYIRKSVALAVFDAKHTKNIATEVRNLQAINEDDYERYILAFENKLNSFSKALKSDDLRDQVLSDQATSLVSQGQALSIELQQKAQKISALELAVLNKEELLQLATNDKDSLSAITQGKLVIKNDQIEKQNNEINTLMLTKQMLELQLAAAQQKCFLIQKSTEEVQATAPAESKLALPINDLPAVNKPLAVEQKVQPLQAEVVTTKVANEPLTEKIQIVNNTVSDLNSASVVTEIKTELEPIVIEEEVVNN